MPTGFSCIDDVYGGIKRGVCTLLLAHTGDGKSVFARQCAEGAAKTGSGVKWFCGEDPEDATAERYLADGSGVTATEMGRLDVSQSQLAKIDKIADESRSWAKYIDVQFEAPSVNEVLEIIDSTTEVNGAPLLLNILDYAQIFGDSASLESEISHLTKELHQRSSKRKMATLILSQVSNDVLRRGRETWNAQHSAHDYVPRLGDTEWCKRAEKNCKAVWSICRINRWMRECGEEIDDDMAEFHVKKANFGPLGWVPLTWDGPGCKFGE